MLHAWLPNAPAEAGIYRRKQIRQFDGCQRRVIPRFLSLRTWTLSKHTDASLHAEYTADCYRPLSLQWFRKWWGRYRTPTSVHKKLQSLYQHALRGRAHPEREPNQ